MAVTYNIKGTTNSSFKIGKNGVVLSPADNTSETTFTIPDASGTAALLESTQTFTGAITFDASGNSVLVSDTLRIAQSGSGLRMTNVGAFDNDGSDNFRIYGTNSLYLRANGENGGGLSIDSTNQDVTVDNDLIVGGNLTVQGTTTTVDSTTVNVQNAFVFEGATANDFETTLTVTDPTVDRTITLPDATGTVVLADATQTLTNKTLGATTISGNILPDTTETYDIGSSTLRFNDIYLAGSTVDIGGTKLSKDSNGDLDIKDASDNRKTIKAAAIELFDTAGKKIKIERDATSGKMKTSKYGSDGSEEASQDVIDISEDLSPKLGGDLDLNSNNITGAGDVNITGDGAFSGNVTVTGNLTVNGTTTTVNSTQIDVQNAVRFEGATADEFETVLTVTDPTADRTITLPDSTGTVVLADTTDTLTNKTLTTPDVNTSLKMVSSGQLQFRDNQSYITENGGILLFNGASGRGVRMYSGGAERVAVSYDGNLELKTGVDIIFEGATSNDFETILTVTDPTADRTVTLPDETGTVALTSNLPSTTDDLSEGSSNLYYTDARSRAGISLGSGTPAYNNTTGVLTVPSTTDHITEGSTNLYYTNARVQAVSINEVVEDTTPQLGGDLDVNGNSITSTSNGDVDIAPHGTGNAKITSTGALILPVGTTAQRPTTPVVGMFRFNSTTDRFEGYNGASWVILGSTLPTNEATDYGATTTTAISNHDYGAITDADTITIDYEDLS